VEILDTDSEGRLVLCDALAYADKYRPAVLVDVATLTGGIVSALGEIATGLFSNSDALVREVLEAADSAWDRAWHMPLWDEYQDTFKSSIADFANVGPHGDCAITAACFLSRFTGRYPWVHLDIAGTATRSGDHRWQRRGRDRAGRWRFSCIFSRLVRPSDGGHALYAAQAV
jgi:leucyl aminopeptidase